MNAVIKELANGLVSGVAPQLIYQSPSTLATATVVKTLNFHNLNTTTNRVVEVFLSTSVGPARHVYTFTIPPEGSAELVEDWTIASGGGIEAVTDAANEVTYVVSGYQFPTQ